MEQMDVGEAHIWDHGAVRARGPTSIKVWHPAGRQEGHASSAMQLHLAVDSLTCIFRLLDYSFFRRHRRV